MTTLKRGRPVLQRRGYTKNLSDGTRARLEMLFGERDREVMSNLLIDECGNNLPGCEDASPEDLERIRFSALKLSAGDTARLRDATALAQTDWRDLLVAADFAHDIHAHLAWWPNARSG